MASLPTRRDALQAVAAPGPDGTTRIYAIGGRDRSTPGIHLNVVEAYDPTEDRWTTCAPMPTRRHGHAAALGPDGRIVVAGGTNRKVFATNEMDVYDPIRDAWSVGTPMPRGVECAAIASTPRTDREVIVFGGWERGKRATGQVEAYSARTGKWRRLPAAAARAAGGAVVLQRSDGSMRAYFIGGTGEDGSGKVKPNGPVEELVEAYVFESVARTR